MTTQGMLAVTARGLSIRCTLTHTYHTSHTHTHTTHAHTCILMCACMQTAKIKKMHAHTHTRVSVQKNVQHFHSVSICRLKQNTAKTLRTGRTRVAQHVKITSLKQVSFTTHLQQTFFTTHTHNLVTCDDHKLQAEVGTNGQKKDNCGWEKSADNCCFCG